MTRDRKNLVEIKPEIKDLSKYYTNIWNNDRYYEKTTKPNRRVKKNKINYINKLNFNSIHHAHIFYYKVFCWNSNR